VGRGETEALARRGQPRGLVDDCARGPGLLSDRAVVLHTAGLIVRRWLPVRPVGELRLAALPTSGLFQPREHLQLGEDALNGRPYVLFRDIQLDRDFLAVTPTNKGLEYPLLFLGQRRCHPASMVLPERSMCPR
jgi:hypothetical protein